MPMPTKPLLESWPCVAFAALLSILGGCNAPMPSHLEHRAVPVEVPTVPAKFTDPVEPSLAVEITPDAVYATSHFLHPLWRERIAKIYQKERAEENWWSARRRVDELVTFLDKKAPQWRADRVKVAELHSGHFDVRDVHSNPGTVDYVQPVFDELSEERQMVINVAATLGVPGALRFFHTSDFEHPLPLLLVVDPTVPSSTVAGVRGAALEAGFDRLQLLVRSDELRSVPMRIEPISVGPPSDQVVPGESCAAAIVSVDESIGLRFDRILRTYDAALADMYEKETTGEWIEAGPRYPNETVKMTSADRDVWNRRPAWDDALVVAKEGTCKSADTGEVNQVNERLQRLVSAFAAAPKCSTAFFEMSRPETGEPTTSYQAMVKTIAALRAVDGVEHVYVDTQHTDPKPTRAADACSRVYVVDVGEVVGE